MTGAKFCDFEKMAAIFLKYWDKYLIDGVSYTLLLSAITVLGGVVFASLLALMKMSKVAPLRWLSAIYIEVIRGTPMLLQLYFFYFGLPFIEPQPVVQGTVSTSGSPLRLRAYPSAAGQTIALMPNGASVTVYGTWQGWNTVEYNGNLGYAAEAYIES